MIYPLTAIYKQACFQFGILRYGLNFNKHRCSYFLHLLKLIKDEWWFQYFTGKKISKIMHHKELLFISKQKVFTYTRMESNITDLPIL